MVVSQQIQQFRQATPWLDYAIAKSRLGTYLEQWKGRQLRDATAKTRLRFLIPLLWNRGSRVQIPSLTPILSNSYRQCLHSAKNEARLFLNLLANGHQRPSYSGAEASGC